MNLVHDREEQAFFVESDGQFARLRYRLDKTTMTIYSTFVPRTLRNRGLAAQLAQAALDLAEALELEVVPTCSYVRAYVDRQARESATARSSNLT